MMSQLLNFQANLLTVVNLMDVKDMLLRTQQLSSLFYSNVPREDRTYLGNVHHIGFFVLAIIYSE